MDFAKRTPSVFRRTLPPACVGFSTPEGKALFTEALSSGGADGYWKLAEVFHTQADPAFCGLASLTMILNALAIDPQRQWRGSVWRFFDEEALDCCVSLETVKREGIVLEALSCLARCNGATVEGRRAPPLNSCCDAPTTSARAPQVCAASPFPVATEAEFLHAVRVACFGGPGVPQTHLVVSFSRASLGQTGGGHFSCVAACAPETPSHPTMLLVLDTARFKYAPFWVAAPALWAAMRAVDASTGQPRGFLSFTRAPEQPQGVLLTLSRRTACCGGAAVSWSQFLGGNGGGAADSALASATSSRPGDDERPSAAIQRVLSAAPRLPLSEAVAVYGGGGGVEDDVLRQRAAVVGAARASPLHAAVVAASATNGGGGGGDEAVALTLLLAASFRNRKGWERAAAAVKELLSLPPGAAADEAAHLAAQLAALRDGGALCG